MKNIKTKFLFALLTLSLLITFSPQQAKAQINPHWGNHEPSGGTGNLVPPQGEVFLRQNPLTSEFDDIKIYASNKSQIVFNVNFEEKFDYEIAEGPEMIKYRRYKADNRYEITGEKGEPEILYRKLWLQVPGDAENFSIDVVNENFYDNVDESNIYPKPSVEWQKIRDDLYQDVEIFTKNEELYATDFWYPARPTIISEEATQHRLKMIDVRVPVMKYNPLKREIKTFRSTTIKIHYSSETEKNVYSTYKNDPFHNLFNGTIANYAYELKEGNPEPPGDGQVFHIGPEDLKNEDFSSANDFYPDYLVICSEKFRDSQAKENWLRNRSTEGEKYNIAVAYTWDIYQEYPESGTPEASIQDFIHFVYDNWSYDDEIPNLKFLILLGDADYDEPTPIYRKTWFLPTWRTLKPDAFQGTGGDNDYVWIDGNDTLDDVMIGRLPAQTEDELRIMVSKIMNFEHIIPHKKNHFGTRHLALIGDTFSASTFENYAHYFLLGQKQELDEFNARYYPFDYDSEKIVKMLNSKGALFVNYNGHGEPAIIWDWTGWMPGVMPTEIKNLDQMTLLTMSLACSTGRFDFSYDEGSGHFEPYDSYGELWIKNPEGGSVCFFGATRWAMSGSHASQLDFFEEIFNHKNYLLGSVLTYVKKEISRKDLHRRIYCLLGDPAINFKNYIATSSKPDFSVGASSLGTYNPQKYNEECFFTTKLMNWTEEPINNLKFQLFSLNKGILDPISDEHLVNMSPSSQEEITDTWTYKAQSGIHFVPWVDPYDKMDELSEFNNHGWDKEFYFPIYLNKTNTSNQQFGTPQEPFAKLKDAIVAIQENNTISQEYRKTNSPSRLFIAEGVYGDGETHVLDHNIFLNGIGKNQESQIIYDNLVLKGSFYQIENLTFDGEKTSGNILSFDTKDPGRYSPKIILKNNIIRQSKKNAIYSSASTKTMYLYNNIIHDNQTAFYDDFLNNNGSDEYTLWRHIYFNTITQNLNNFSSSQTPNPTEDDINIYFNSNIIYNNGESLFPAQTLEQNINISSLKWNDTDDEILISNASPSTTEGNINEDPKLMDSLIWNFHLKPTSPCIDTGYPEHSDPDGSPADMGAYGGYNAIIRPIRIIYPVHESNIYIQQTWNNLFNIDLQWKTHDLLSNETIHIQISHWENNGLVNDIDELIPNNESFQATICQFPLYRNYFLTISSEENPEIKEFIKVHPMPEF